MQPLLVMVVRFLPLTMCFSSMFISGLPGMHSNETGMTIPRYFCLHRWTRETFQTSLEDSTTATMILVMQFSHVPAMDAGMHHAVTQHSLFVFEV